MSRPSIPSTEPVPTTLEVRGDGICRLQAEWSPLRESSTGMINADSVICASQEPFLVDTEDDVTDTPTSRTMRLSASSNTTQKMPFCRCPVIVTTHESSDGAPLSEPVPLSQAWATVRRAFDSSTDIKITICKDCSPAVLFKVYRACSRPISFISCSSVTFSSMEDFCDVLRVIQNVPGIHCLQMKSAVWNFAATDATTCKPAMSLRSLALKEIRILSEVKVVSVIAMNFITGSRSLRV